MLLLFNCYIQDPVETSSCLDFYKLVLFYTTTGSNKISQADQNITHKCFVISPLKHLTGAATLGAIGVALLLVTKAVKRSEKEKKPFKK